MTVHVVAHIDVDGLVSHSIAEMWARKSGLITKHYFVNYQDIGIALRIISEVIKPDDAIVIADIGFNKELINSFLDQYGKLAEKTSWFDHHHWSEEAVARVSSVVKELIVDESLCASEITKKRFLPDDELAKELANLARAHDFYGKGFEPKVFKQACKIQDVITSGYCKEVIVERLVNGILWDDDFEAVYQSYQKVRTIAVQEMDNTATDYFVTINDIVADLVVVLVPDILESKDVRAHLLAREKDAVIAIWSDGRIAYQIREKKFQTIIEKINANFNGGGRGLAGGAVYPKIISRDNYRKHFDKIIEVLRR